LRVSKFFTADELIAMFSNETDRADVLDLSGGQPDIVPEWVLWTMQALERTGLAGKVFLWSDDNLSNRYHWEYLSSAQRAYMARFPCYSRVGCFKGFDASSFAFNTRAAPELFDQQFEIFRSLLLEGYDIYAYVTLTSPPVADVRTSVARFVDRLQGVDSNLPLRTVPLRIAAFTPTKSRMEPLHEEALSFQHEAHDAWLDEVRRRFTAKERELPITDVLLRAS
jgi:Predicted Fe-S oxidoreductase